VARMRYRACVETETERGREVLFTRNEGFNGTRVAWEADYWTSRREAEAAGRFYARLCNDAAAELGLPQDSVFVGVSPLGG
jgi:hypothetical protein